MSPRVLLSLNAESFFVPMWVQAYVDAGYEIDIVSRYDIKRNLFCDQILSALRGEGKGKLNFRTSSSNMPGGKFADYVKTAVEISALARRSEYDAMHVHFLSTRGFGALASGIDNLILSPYGSDIFSENAWGGSLPRWLPNLLIKRLINKASLILPTSTYMKNYLLNRFHAEPSKVFTKSWGIDLEQWSKDCSNSKLADHIDFDEGTIVFLSYRSAKPLYRIHLLPSIHALLEETGIEARFIYCMNSNKTNPYSRFIVDAIKKKGLEQKSHVFHHPLRANTLRCLLDKSDYFFSIPRWDQLSATLLEGLYRRVIPIIPPLLAYEELINQGCRMVVAKPTPSSIAKAIMAGVSAGLHSDGGILTGNKAVVEKHHNRRTNFGEIMRRISEAISA